jgi:predicted type IV restriction endonuclease/predicted transport protein
MKNVVQQIREINSKLTALRRKRLNEASTRTIVIEPILGALGWDIRDPEEVEIEYPTVDKKPVDYALKINRKPELLVEAKPLEDPLNDVKAATQVIGYAASEGIEWCILTNGIKWKVYKSTEKCPAPEKLTFEISIDLNEKDGLPLEQIAELLNRLSKEEIAKGTLDEIGEQTFTDGKVRKALDKIVTEPPRSFIKLLRDIMGEENLSPQKIKDSIVRIWPILEARDTDIFTVRSSVSKVRLRSPKKLTRRGKKPKKLYSEAQHIINRPAEILELYRKLDTFCLSLKPGEISKEYLAKTINYLYKDIPFCSVHILKSGLRIWLYLKYDEIENPPGFSRDVSGIGHWGGGGFEMGVKNSNQLYESERLIQLSFESRCM